MERDALLAHGTSFLLQDRLMNCSDYSTAWVCRRCGSLISLGFDELAGQGVTGEGMGGGEYCRICHAEEERNRGLVKVEGGEEGVGVVVKGEKRGEMDVIAVPCECLF